MLAAMSLMPYPRYASDRTASLNGRWSFAYLGDDVDAARVVPGDHSTNDTISVPGVFDACPRWAGRRGVGLYRTTVKVTPGAEAVLRFDGLGLWAALFVDGDRLAEHELPYTGWEVRVPPRKDEIRHIDVVISNVVHARSSDLIQPYADFYLYGGLYRGVWLRELPGPAIRSAKVRVLDAQAGRIAVDLEAFDAVSKDAELAASFDGVAPKALPGVHWDSTYTTVELDVPDPRPWSPASPNLHVLALTLGDDVYETRFGLRQVDVVGREIRINGEPVELRGVCRHEAHPQYGPALPDTQLVQDMQWLQRLGCNVVRGAHYAQDPRFLDLCDEVGMLVFEESLGWQAHPEHFEDALFVERCERQTRLMVQRSFNHPSVIMWGFLNEAFSHEESSRPVFERLVSAVKEEDASRPVTFASMKPFDDLNLDLVDIVCLNVYPGWYADAEEGPRPLHTIVPLLDRALEHLEKNGLGDKPMIVSEIGAGAIYGWRDALHGHWTEDYQRDLLVTVLEKIDEDPRINGVMLWQFCDGRTYNDGRALFRPRAFNNKGLLDEYRRPKLAADAVARRFTKTSAIKD